MPVVDKREPRDSKSLLNKLRAQAKAKDDKAMCQSVQEDFNISGLATYNIAPKTKTVLINLPGGPCLVFLMVGGFKVDDDEKTTTDKGLGHIVQGACITLEAATAVVIVSGY